MKTTYINSVVNLLPASQQIRNISVIAHVDHGKTTLVDSLLSKAGIIKQEDAGKKRVMDTKEEEIARGITIKSTGISLVFNQDNKEYLVNLVDSPGHVDFSSEVTAALRITDGALVVVDCVEGVCVQTEMVARQALTERIRPVLHVNKVDRGIMELQLSPEDLYQRLNEVILNVNQVFSKFEDEALGDVSVDPIKGTASFGSGKQGWAFTMPMIAKRVSQQTGKPYETILNRLWGDHFYDPSTRKFTSSSTSAEGKPLERYVCQKIFSPLCKIFKAVRENDLGTLFDKMLPAIDVTLTTKEKELVGNDLLSRILQQWLPAGDALVGMIVDHLPSPVQAQKYRVDKLYTGPLDDPVATAIRNCDPNGPLTVFISKMVPSSDGNRFFAFGRVFSGTIRPKADVYIMNSDYLEKKTTTTKKVSRLVLMMGRTIENVDEVPCGNNVGISGLDSVLIKSGTLSSLPDGFPIAPMKFSVSPVVRRALSLPNVANLSLFVKALKKLVNSDPCLQVITESSGECVIAGAGELHIEVALNDLREFLGPSIAFNVSPPVVKLSETVTSTSSVVCLGKSPNKLNRVYVTAEPMAEKLVQDLEDKKLPLDNPKELASILVKDYGWDKGDALKLWWMEGSNCLVDCSSAVPYLHTVKDHLIGAVKLAASEGVLAGEPLRGVRFNIIDATLHSDSVHRGPGQLVQTARRAFLAAQLCAKPALVEPIFLSEISCDQKVVSKIYSLISQKRGSVFDEQSKDGSMVLVRGHLPVLESFGFDSLLREATSGQATPQLMFAHWSCLPGDPFVDGFSRNVLVSVRERKKMKAQLPILSDYNDKL